MDRLVDSVTLLWGGGFGLQKYPFFTRPLNCDILCHLMKFGRNNQGGLENDDRKDQRV